MHAAKLVLQVLQPIWQPLVKPGSPAIALYVAAALERWVLWLAAVTITAAAVRERDRPARPAQQRAVRHQPEHDCCIEMYAIAGNWFAWHVKGDASLRSKPQQLREVGHTVGGLVHMFTRAISHEPDLKQLT
jgi:hypothetical protein